MKSIRTLLAATSALACASMAQAADIEITHWWTSGGEAAAVAELAKAFNERTDHTWIDGAIAGSGSVARPIMVARITGGDPMAATQFNHGRQAEELVEAGLMRDLTDIAEANNWRDVINPSSLLDSCTVDGRIYCAPLNIHSNQWLWLNNAAFTDNGMEVPTTWDEFVAAGPALREAGITPLAMGQQGWQQNLAFGVLVIALTPPEVYMSVYDDKDVDVAAGPEIRAVFQAAADARDLSSESNVQDWNMATNLVITGQAAGQIMGDWAQGEFAVAGQTAGDEYTCLPGLGGNKTLVTAGDAFYFPVLDDADKSEAQGELAALLLDPDVQVAFNLRKGSLPVRGDVNLEAANDCMQKGLDILATGDALPATDQLVNSDTRIQLEELFVEFFADKDMTVDDAQARFVDIIADAE